MLILLTLITSENLARTSSQCQSLRGVARIFQRGLVEGGNHTVPHPGYLHSPLQMFGPENEVCNYLALEKIYGMLILRICAVSPPEL